MCIQSNKNNSNYEFEYEYFDVFGERHTNTINISNQKHQPSPFRVAAAIVARWNIKGYTQGVSGSIAIINITTFN
jgi:hypothetical protein